MKKMLSIALSTAMVLSLAGCGGSNKNASTTDSTTTATEADKPADGSSEAASNPDALEPVTLTLYSPGNENSVPTKTILEYKKLSFLQGPPVLQSSMTRPKSWICPLSLTVQSRLTRL